jgi:uncharacterized protein (TIGR02001 family)
MVYGEERRRSAFVIAFLALAAACVGLSHQALAVPSFETTHFDVDVAVSSDYVVHGITRSQGKPVVQAQVGWSGESGWMLGTWLSTMDLNPGRGPNRVFDPYVAKRWLLGRDWALRTDLTRYMFRPSIDRVPYDYTELRGALTFRDVFDVALSWSPDYSGYSWLGPASHRTMLTYEASGHFPVSRWLGVNAGIGRRDLEEVFGTSYWYWSAGTEATFQRWSLALTYIGSSYEARTLYTPEYAGKRLVATVSMRVR